MRVHGDQCENTMKLPLKSGKGSQALLLGIWDFIAQLWQMACLAGQEGLLGGVVSTLYTRVLISLVSKMYPRGIQFRKRSRVSRVAWTRGAFWEFSCHRVGEVGRGVQGGVLGLQRRRRRRSEEHTSELQSR